MWRWEHVRRKERSDARCVGMLLLLLCCCRACSRERERERETSMITGNNLIYRCMAVGAVHQLFSLASSLLSSVSGACSEACRLWTAC